MIKEMLGSIDNQQASPTNQRNPNPDLRQFANAANLANDYDRYDAEHHDAAHTNAPGKRVIVEDLLSRKLGMPSMEEELIRREQSHAQTAPHPPATRHPDGFYPNQNGDAPGVFFQEPSHLPPKPGMPLTPAGTLSSQYDLPPHLPAGQHSMAFSQQNVNADYSQGYPNYPNQYPSQQAFPQQMPTMMAAENQGPNQSPLQNQTQQNAPPPQHYQQQQQQPQQYQQPAPQPVQQNAPQPVQQPAPTPQPPLPAAAPVVIQSGSMDIQDLRKLSESIKRSSGITNLIMEQVKELVEIDSNLNNKIKEIEVRINQLEEQFNIFKKTADENQRKFQLFDRNMQKFIGLYEIISNQYNPFTAKSNFVETAQQGRRRPAEQDMTRQQPAPMRRAEQPYRAQPYEEPPTMQQQPQQQAPPQERQQQEQSMPMNERADMPNMREQQAAAEQKPEKGKYDERLKDILSKMNVQGKDMQKGNVGEKQFEIEKLAHAAERSMPQKEEQKPDLDTIQKAIENQVIRQLSDMVKGDKKAESPEDHSRRFSQEGNVSAAESGRTMPFTPQIKQEYHQPVEPQFNMRLNSGKEVTNLPQLMDAFREMDDSTFMHHVTPDKNDFYNWIKDIIKDDGLARAILPLRTKEDMIRAIQYRIYHTV